jgi:putative ABC transport system permease protein
LINPEMRIRDVVMSRGGKTVSPFVFMGTWPGALEMSQHEIEHGRMFTELDDEWARPVCVIGTEVRDELFGSPENLGYELNPVGEHVNIRGQVFTIIGMFRHYESEQDRKAREHAKANPAEQTGPDRNRGRGGRGGSGWVFRVKNNTVYIPLNTMWLRFRASSGTNNTPDPRLSSLSLKVANVEKLESAIEQAHNALIRTHNGIQDFSFQTQEEWSQRITESIKNARLSGGIIAAISLIVGGIGIMNIMLASITERIREIGIRKAIGATGADIFDQNHVESVVIAVLCGAAGLQTSMALVKLLTFISHTGNTPEITVTACIFSF